MARALAACFATLQLLHLCGSEHGSERLLHGDHHPAAYVLRTAEPRLIYAPPSQASSSQDRGIALELDLRIGGLVDGFHYRVEATLCPYNETGDEMQLAFSDHDLMGSGSPVFLTASFGNPQGARYIFQVTVLDMHPALREEERPVAMWESKFSGLMAQGPVNWPSPAGSPSSGPRIVLPDPQSSRALLEPGYAGH
jgi:hypothetical protein